MTRKTLSAHAAAAKIIRAELKRNGIVAKVRARTASMMSAVDVDVVDLSPAAIREISSYVRRFEYGTFDGMTDCYNVDNRDDSIPQVKYTQVHVSFSDEMREAARAHCAGYWADWDSLSEMDRETRVYRTLANDRPCTEGHAFWLARKPRITVPAGSGCVAPLT